MVTKSLPTLIYSSSSRFIFLTYFNINNHLNSTFHVGVEITHLMVNAGKFQHIIVITLHCTALHCTAHPCCGVILCGNLSSHHILGLYTCTRKVTQDEFENKAKKVKGYATVSHFNVIHYNRHSSISWVQLKNSLVKISTQRQHQMQQTFTYLGTYYYWEQFFQLLV